MGLELRKVDAEHRVVLERLLQFHLYETGMEPGPEGLVDWGESLDPFFCDSNFLALFIVWQGQDAGFVLAKLDHSPPDPSTGEPIRVHFIEEYFLLRPHRRQGLGTQAFDQMTVAYPGPWLVSTHPDEARVAFWRHVAVGRPGAQGKEFTPDEQKVFPGQFVWCMPTREPGS